METQTLLATLWNMPSDDAAQDARNAEAVRSRLASGDLEPAGNCRNEGREYWAKDDENE